jgi:ABC-type protease/lipase transport system fused ATPase/permease subunit
MSNIIIIIILNSQSTVITIAHRLNTIMDYDYVLVMDKGQVAEFDNPVCTLTYLFFLLSFLSFFSPLIYILLEMIAQSLIWFVVYHIDGIEESCR